MIEESDGPGSPPLFSCATAFVFDYIKYNPDVRHFWETRIEEIKSEGLDDFVATKKLAQILVQVYSSKAALDDLIGLVDQIDLMTMDWSLLADALLEKGIETEIKNIDADPVTITSEISAPNVSAGSPALSWRLPPPMKPEEEYLGERLAAFDNAEKKYLQSIKSAKTAKIWAAIPALFVGFILISYFKQQTSSELTVSDIPSVVIFAIVCACFVWPFLALFIQMCEPKQKPDFLYYLSCSIDKIRRTKQ